MEKLWPLFSSPAKADISDGRRHLAVASYSNRVDKRSMEAIAIVGTDGAIASNGWLGPVPWWSFTKTALSVATLRLAEEGLIELDAPLSDERYSPRHLLRHEAGLPDYGGIARYHADVEAGKRPWPTARLLEAVDAPRLRSEPGTAWAYSNVGYLKIAQLIERTTGRALGAALASLVFEPAGLSTARLATHPVDLADVQMGSATGYHPGWVYHGLIVGSVADAARFLWALVHGLLLKPATWAAMKEGRPLPDYRSDGHPDPAYGLGLMLRAQNPEAHPMGHGGAGPGSKIAVYANHGRVGAVWTTLPATMDVDARVNEILGAK